VNTLNTNVQVEGAYRGSVPAGAVSGQPLNLTLTEVIRRGLEYNLGPIGSANAVRQARAQAETLRSRLLPNINGELREVVQKTNLRALGIRLPMAPTVIGPFNYFDLRARLTQTIADFTALNNYRSAKESAAAADFAVRDARDFVVLAVGGAYVQTLASAARIDAARAQLETARTLNDQARQFQKEGLLARIDVNRSNVQLRTQEQRLASLENDYAKQKLNLSRMIGLPPGQTFQLTDKLQFQPVSNLTVEQALDRAYNTRADLKSAEAQVRAAERALDAARAQRLPSLAFTADYGLIGVNPAQSNGTFTVAGSLQVPLWHGGRINAEIQQAQAGLSQRRAELEDLRARIDADVRTAFLDLETAASQVHVAEASRDATRDTLQLTRERFEAGIADTTEVVQAQEALAVAEQDVVSSLFAHNAGKMSLARAIGAAEESIRQFVRLD
jgi:outer membrane protein TolC